MKNKSKIFFLSFFRRFHRCALGPPTWGQINCNWIFEQIGKNTQNGIWIKNSNRTKYSLHSPALLSVNLEAKEELAEDLIVEEQLTVDQVASKQADGVLLIVAAVVALIIVLVCIRVLLLVLLWIVLVELQADHVPTIVETEVEEKKNLAENPTSLSWKGGIVCRIVAQLDYHLYIFQNPKNREM